MEYMGAWYINVIEKRKQPASASQIFSFCLFQNLTQVRFTQVPPSHYCIIFCSKSTTQSPWKSPRDCEIRLIRSYNSLRMPRFLRYLRYCQRFRVWSTAWCGWYRHIFVASNQQPTDYLNTSPTFPPVTRFEDLHDADACRWYSWRS